MEFRFLQDLAPSKKPGGTLPFWLYFYKSTFYKSFKKKKKPDPVHSTTTSEKALGKKRE